MAVPGGARSDENGRADTPAREIARSADAAAVSISGAGPAGLAAAMTLARAGVPTVVHEFRHDVGARFHGDFQGRELDNARRRPRAFGTRALLEASSRNATEPR
jgi:2-polyprenyl-6-methoxyphenol hydroxylase-like FAD-dependent oxidoreductase